MASEDEKIAISSILRKAEAPTFMDLGAHLGEDTDWMIQACAHEPRFLLIEADAANYRSIAARYPFAIRGAISDHSGKCDFWECSTDGGRGSGSIRNPSPHQKKNPDYDFHLVDPIPCFMLDDLFISTGWDHIDVLWVDIQGAERDMIAGGARALRATRYLFIEADIVPLYEGAAGRAELLELLPDFSVVGVFDYNLLLSNDKR